MKGDVVVVPFPFSDLSRTKRRPALVVAVLEGDDLILCQITSRMVRDSYAMRLESADFQDGELRQNSNIRQNRLFTADTRLILYRVGRLTQMKMNEATEAVVRIVRG